jgi:hypothetical protein
MMICLAIMVAVIGAFFFYIRQKMASYEHRLSLLSDTIQTMAGIARANHDLFVQEDENEEESEDEKESDDEESDEESEENNESGDERCMSFGAGGRPRENNEYIENIVFDVEPIELTPIPKIIVSDDDVVKTVTIDTSYDSLTLKELKEKVTELNGPKLKTKKELIDFLVKNKL